MQIDFIDEKKPPLIVKPLLLLCVVIIIIFTAGSDYNGTVAPRVFTFSSDVSIHSFQLPLINDSTFETSESLTASLSFTGPMPPGVSIGPDTVNITIEDEDCK
jgi:hypothetical protein